MRSWCVSTFMFYEYEYIVLSIRLTRRIASQTVVYSNIQATCWQAKANIKL